MCAVLLLTWSKWLPFPIRAKRLQRLLSTPFKMGQHKRLEAFSLLEAALYLAIMGIVLGSITPIFTTFSKMTIRKETQKRQVQLLRVLASYAHTHQTLPFPGNGEGIMQEGLQTGILPFKTLGIPEALTKDRQGRPTKYTIALLDRGDNFCTNTLLRPIPGEENTENPVVIVLEDTTQQVRSAVTQKTLFPLYIHHPCPRI